MSQFFRSARERVLSTAAQVSAALASVEGFIVVTGIGAEHWQRLTAYGVVATGLAVVKALAARKVGDPNSASLNRATQGVTYDDLLEQVRELSTPCDLEGCPKRDQV